MTNDYVKTSRTAIVTRQTNETQISVSLHLDGTGSCSVSTGLGFFDHMLNALVKHARFDLELSCVGDLEVDDHHTIEDCGLVIGQAIDQALGDRAGIARFATGFSAMDESLCRCVIDISGRGHSSVDLGFTREMLGSVSTENLSHFFVSLASTLKCALHIDLLRGSNDHHKAEAGFKSTALALRQAVAQDQSDQSIPSTKGVI